MTPFSKHEYISYSVMGVSLNLTTPIKFSLTLINSDVHCILCKVYNRVDSSKQSWDWAGFFTKSPQQQKAPSGPPKPEKLFFLVELRTKNTTKSILYAQEPNKVKHKRIEKNQLHYSAQSLSLLSLQYLKFSELI